MRTALGDGEGPCVRGERAPSSAYQVAAAPEPPPSLTLSVTVAGPSTAPPWGAGDSEAVVTGGVVSTSRGSRWVASVVVSLE